MASGQQKCCCSSEFLHIAALISLCGTEPERLNVYCNFTFFVLLSSFSQYFCFIQIFGVAARLSCKLLLRYFFELCASTYFFCDGPPPILAYRTYLKGLDVRFPCCSCFCFPLTETLYCCSFMFKVKLICTAVFHLVGCFNVNCLC